MENLYILDAVSFLFRAYHAIRNMTNREGRATGALFGFIRSVRKVIKDFHPTHLVAVFDGRDNRRSRTAIYERYKENRARMPEDLFDQFLLALKFCEYSGIPYLAEPGTEADDVIGVIAKWAEKQGGKVFICSEDKDLAQLVSDTTLMIHVHKENRIVDRGEVERLYGVEPEQIVDYLALMGDRSDNIPGIPGFGAKTAASLLRKHGTLDRILADPEGLTTASQAEKIKRHRESALLSRRLATLIPDLPCPEEEGWYALKTPDEQQLVSLYKEMDFASLLKESGRAGSEVTTDYRIVESLSALKALVEELSGAKRVVFDTETTSLRLMEARLIGIGFCKEEGKAYYVPVYGALEREVVMEHVRALFADDNIEWIGHNLKYDCHVLCNHDIPLPRIAFDTMLASYLLQPGANRHGLDFLVLAKFDKVKTSIGELIGTGKNRKPLREVPVAEVGAYCCEDADYTFRLYVRLREEIAVAKLESLLYDVEQPLIPVLLAMERQGVYVDKGKLHRMSCSLYERISRVEREIRELAQESFNIRSTKQLREVLFTKMAIDTGKRKASTGADVLEAIRHKHPIVGKILEFRKLDKLRSTYVDSLPSEIDPKTGRIHPTFMQTVTATGRLSCRDPNLQNIPTRSQLGKKIREAFRPDPEEGSYLSADYSQIELRLLAHMSRDTGLVAAFRNDEDVHVTTAAAIFGLPRSQVTAVQRFQAKSVNFGIIYGQQATGLAGELGISREEAATFITHYFKQYPGVYAFLEKCRERVRERGEATTLLGRRRPIPGIHSANSAVRSGAERLAVNTPLQGSQADIIKVAMIRIDTLMRDRPATLILQVHDELIFELPGSLTDAEMEDIRGVISETMSSVVSLSVPLKVNSKIGKNWAEC
ncbi:MAG: DNA polymerase I [Simkaniaceae bacterium]|nr:DNA polymerase I [Simkaniaceae bacterium]